MSRKKAGVKEGVCTVYGHLVMFSGLGMLEPLATGVRLQA
jgi:hypothetical protein